MRKSKAAIIDPDVTDRSRGAFVGEVAEVLAQQQTNLPPQARGPPSDDWLWGALAIGNFIGRKPTQVYYLHSIGAFGNAVKKLGHKTLVGSRRGLRRIMFNNQDAI